MEDGVPLCPPATAATHSDTPRATRCTAGGETCISMVGASGKPRGSPQPPSPAMAEPVPALTCSRCWRLPEPACGAQSRHRRLPKTSHASAGLQQGLVFSEPFGLRARREGGQIARPAQSQLAPSSHHRAPTITQLPPQPTAPLGLCLGL